MPTLASMTRIGLEGAEINLRILRGETTSWRFTIETDGERQDLTGAAITWTSTGTPPIGLSNDPDGGIVLDDQTAAETKGQGTVTLTFDAELPPPGFYRHQLTVTLPDGDPAIPAHGELVIEDP